MAVLLHPVLAVARPAIRFGQGILCMLAAVLMVFAPLSYVFRSEGLVLVQRHFGEAHSTYPALSVALFFIACSILTGLAALYLIQVVRLLSHDQDRRPRTHKNPAQKNPAQIAWRMAWLMLAMCALLYPVGQYGLIVEVAFKGPTSEVTAPFWLPASMALIGAFAWAINISLFCREPSA